MRRRISHRRRYCSKSKPRWKRKKVIRHKVYTVRLFTTDFKTRKKQIKFLGACQGTGAQKSVIGVNQAKAYCRESNVRMKLKQSHSRFKFGDGDYRYFGRLDVRIPTPDGSYLPLSVDVANADVPLLIGLDVLDRLKLVANNFTK